MLNLGGASSRLTEDYTARHVLNMPGMARVHRTVPEAERQRQVAYRMGVVTGWGAWLYFYPSLLASRTAVA